MIWIASSGLVHLDEIPVDRRPQNVHFLNRQWRMHPEIAEAVSLFMYGGELLHADVVYAREKESPFALYQREKDLFSSDEENEGPPRAVWYVLDEEVKGPSIRHDRGPGNKSYVREGSFRALDKLFENENFAKANGLFISPFVAQAKRVREYFAKKGHKTWNASTVHCQQGQEADIVIFDTVNAGSTGWIHHEWMRMINVGISRARRLLVLIASRAEMSQPFLKPLCRSLQASSLASSKERFQWKEVATIRSLASDKATFDPATGMLPEWVRKIPPGTLGRQIAERQLLDPVLSQLQQQLCNREMDGKPRLIRGVAGSGKTAILAEWLVRSLIRHRKNINSSSRKPFWVVFGNNTLESLVKRHVDAAWEKYAGETSPPEGAVVYHHILRLLDALATEQSLGKTIREKIKRGEIQNNYDYDGKSAAILDALPDGKITPRCKALFIDEAQDMGPNTLRLLFKLIEPLPKTEAEIADDSIEDGPIKTTEEKPVYIFYDNAQNVYGRGTPVWSHLGIDLKGGRATVMKESFRSTREISELALNVLYRLKPDELGDDHKELIRSGLIDKTQRNGNEWWNVRFNQNTGPKPTVWEFSDRGHEFTVLADELVYLLKHEHVPPEHIRILCNNRQSFMKCMDEHVRPRLRKEMGDRVDYVYKEDGILDDNTILVTSAHSFKGYESEIVFIPAADMFESSGDILAPPLYVAMTRARSILKISYTTSDREEFIKRRIKFFKRELLERRFEAASRLCNMLRDCSTDFQALPLIEASEPISPQENFEVLLESLVSNFNVRNVCEKWLRGIQSKYLIETEPIISNDGDVLGEPLFFFRAKNKTFACYGNIEVSRDERERLEQHGVFIIEAGEKIE